MQWFKHDTSRAVQQTKERLKIAGVKGTISSSTLLKGE